MGRRHQAKIRALDKPGEKAVAATERRAESSEMARMEEGSTEKVAWRIETGSGAPNAAERTDMSYCVNCGVELEPCAKECPLCNTPVVNPREQLRQNRQGASEAQASFPKEKGQVETVKRKDFGLLLSMVILASVATCGTLNLFVFKGTPWSLAVIGACMMLWVFMIPALIYTRQSVYVSLLLDGAAVALYLYMLTFLVGGDEWFFGLGLPIVLLVTVIAEAMTVCIRRLPRSFLTVSLYLFTALGLLCLGLEILIRRYLEATIRLSWSAVVLTICTILDIAVITMLSRRRLRNEVRRRLHF